MRRVAVVFLASTLGCASGERSPAGALSLGPWRLLAAEEMGRHHLAIDPADADHAYLGGEKRISRIRLSDGRIETVAEMDDYVDGLQVWKDALYALTPGGLSVVRPGRSPQILRAGAFSSLMLVRHPGILLMAAASSIECLDLSTGTWTAARVGQHAYLLTGSAETVAFATDPIDLRARFVRPPIERFGRNTAWQSRTDPSYIVASAGISRDEGRTWNPITPPRAPACSVTAYEDGSSRLLILEDNIGKFSVGPWGWSDWQTSSDDGATWRAGPKAEFFAMDFEVAGRTLVATSWLGQVWVAPIVSE